MYTDLRSKKFVEDQIEEFRQHILNKLADKEHLITSVRQQLRWGNRAYGDMVVVSDFYENGDLTDLFLLRNLLMHHTSAYEYVLGISYEDQSDIEYFLLQDMRRRRSFEPRSVKEGDLIVCRGEEDYVEVLTTLPIRTVHIGHSHPLYLEGNKRAENDNLNTTDLKCAWLKSGVDNEMTNGEYTYLPQVLLSPDGVAIFEVDDDLIDMVRDGDDEGLPPPEFYEHYLVEAVGVPYESLQKVIDIFDEFLVEKSNSQQNLQTQHKSNSYKKQ